MTSISSPTPAGRVREKKGVMSQKGAKKTIKKKHKQKEKYKKKTK